MRYIYIIIFLLFSSYINANETLTLKQQLDRLMEEVEDLNKIVFSNSNNSSNNNDIQKFQSIDIRIYELEKDIKNLTLQFEELLFKLDDIQQLINTTNSGEDISLKLKELEARVIMLE